MDNIIYGVLQSNLWDSNLNCKATDEYFMKHKVALRQEKVKLWGHKAKEPLTQKLKLATGLKKIKNSSKLTLAMKIVNIKATFHYIKIFYIELAANLA